jgi:putative membrane protein
MTFTETAKALGMRLIARALAGRLEIEASGLDHIPPQGPVILAARHYHHLFDGLALLLTLPRPTHVVVTLDWAPNGFTRAAMEALTRLAGWPVIARTQALVTEADRARRQTIFSGGRAQRDQRAGLRAALRLLMEGRALVVFPEGYPNIDPHYTPKRYAEEWLPFKGGFAAIAAAAERRSRAKIPIVPVGLHYRREGRWKVRLRFGTPVCLRDFPSRRCLIDYVEAQVRFLSRIEDGRLRMEDRFPR